MPAKKRTTRRKRTMPPRDPRTGAFRKRTTRRARPARKPVAKRRTTARRNPTVSRADTQYFVVYRHPEKGNFYFDGQYMTNTMRSAAFYKDKKKAHKIAQEISEQLNQPIAVHST